MNKSRIISNLLILGSGRVATMLISSLFLIVVTRYLGPFRFGELAFAEAIIGLLGQVNALGMETFLIRAVAREPERRNALVSAAILVRATLVIPVPLILAAYIYQAHIGREVSTVAYILAIGMVIWSFSVVLLWMLQGLERMSFGAITDIVLNVVLLAGAGLIILLRGGVVAIAASITLTHCLLLVLNLYWAKPFVRLTVHVSWAEIREVITGSLAFWAKDVTMTFYANMDPVILGSLAGTRAVGFYSPPSRVFAVGLFVPNIVGNATLPLLSRLGIDEAGHDFARVSRKTLSLLIVTGVPLVVGLATFARPLIAILFGPAFEPAVPVLVLFSVCLLPMFLNSQFSYILTGRDQQWRWTGIMVASTVIKVAANLILIPLAVHYWHNGALGAAIALLGTELLSTIYGAVILREIVLGASLGRISLGALIAGAAQAGVIWLLSSQLLLLFVGEGLGAAVYIAVAIALGALPRNDVALLWHTVLRRPQKTAA